MKNPRIAPKPWYHWHLQPPDEMHRTMGGPLDTSDRRYLQEYLSIIPGGLNIDLDNYSTGWEPPRIVSGILT